MESKNWSTDPSFKSKPVYLHCETHGDSELMSQEWAGKAHREHLDIWGDDCVVTMMSVIQMIDEERE